MIRAGCSALAGAVRRALCNRSVSHVAWHGGAVAVKKKSGTGLNLGAFVHALPIGSLFHLLSIVLLVAGPAALLFAVAFVYRLRKGPI